MPRPNPLLRSRPKYLHAHSRDAMRCDGVSPQFSGSVSVFVALVSSASSSVPLSSSDSSSAATGFFFLGGGALPLAAFNTPAMESVLVC